MSKRGRLGVRRSTQTDDTEGHKKEEKDESHHDATGGVPGDQLDWDLKEISGEGYCQNGMFLDPGDRALELFSSVTAVGESRRA